VIFAADKACGVRLFCLSGGIMFEGLFQPMHLIILLIVMLVVAGGLFLAFQVLWPLLRRPS
jgi:hypothetical protein